MDAPYDPEVSSVVLMWASQTTGKTETVNNIVGHTIDIDPCPMLVIQPTLDMGETWSKDRLSTMLRDTPRLRGKVKDARSRDADNKILHKRFPAGAITIAGANSPASLASRPIRKVLFDEIDRYPASAGAEGDPIALAEKRTESFPDAVSFKISTPTIKGASRIEVEFDKSDKRYWFVKHSCGHEFHFKWLHIEWNTEDKKDCWIRCPGCQVKILDVERQDMIRNAESVGCGWRATAPFDGVRGYHMNGIYCLFRPKKPFKNRLQQMVAGFIEAKAGGLQTLKVWTNTFLAECWADSIDEKPEAAELEKRVEDYGGDDKNNPILPEDVCVLIGAVDIQHDRLELTVAGYGLGEETWAIEHVVFWGDTNKRGTPTNPGAWENLDTAINKNYTHELGGKLKLAIVVLDTSDGKRQKMAYSFIKPRQIGRVFAIKGSSTANAQLVATAKMQKKHRIQLFTLGTDTGKSTVYGRLSLVDHGPGYMHYPGVYDHATQRLQPKFGFTSLYFKGLISEECGTTYRKGAPIREWRKTFERNEPLDNRVYILGAFEILNPNLPKLKELIDAQAPKSVQKDYHLKPVEEPKPELPKPQPFVRRSTPRNGSWVRGWKK